jgi:hypothetical protein
MSVETLWRTIYHKLQDIVWWFGVHLINNEKYLSVFLMNLLPACSYCLALKTDSKFLWNIDIYLAG